MKNSKVLKKDSAKLVNEIPSKDFDGLKFARLILVVLLLLVGITAGTLLNQSQKPQTLKTSAVVCNSCSKSNCCGISCGSTEKCFGDNSGCDCVPLSYVTPREPTGIPAPTSFAGCHYRDGVDVPVGNKCPNGKLCSRNPGPDNDDVYVCDTEICDPHVTLYCENGHLCQWINPEYLFPTCTGPTASEIGSCIPMYWCRLSDHTCQRTSSTYNSNTQIQCGGSTTCSQNLAIHLPGKSTGDCSGSLQSCQRNCSPFPPTNIPPPRITGRPSIPPPTGIKFTPTPSRTPTPKPLAKTPAPKPVSCQYGPYTVPGRVEAENFTCGGEQVGYHDTTSGNSGKTYRTNDNVDIQKTGDSSGAYNVGWTRTGEWLSYKIKAASSGRYKLTFRVASPYSVGKFRVYIDGVAVTTQKAIPNTGSFQTYTNLIVSGVSLTAGTHTFKINIEGNSVNFNYIDFSRI